MPYNPTAFAHTPKPSILQGTGLGLQAAQAGQQDRLNRAADVRAQGLHDVTMQQSQNTLEMQRRSMSDDDLIRQFSQSGLEAWKAGDTQGFDNAVAAIAPLDPERAKTMSDTFGMVSRQNFVEAAHNILAATVVENPDTQNAQLDAAIDKLDVGPEHPFAIELEKIKAMPKGRDRDVAMLLAVEYAKQLGVFPAKAAQEQAAAKTAATGKTDVQKQVNVLHESIKQPRKIFSMVNAAKNRIDQIWDDATGASDLAMIFNFMKMHDPESVVREAEFKTAETARGWWSSLSGTEKEEVNSLYGQVANKLGGMPAFIDIISQKFDTGGRLTEDQRQDMKNVSDKMGAAAQQTFDVELENMFDRADADKIPRSRLGANLVKEYEARKAARAAMPAQSATPAPITPGPIAVQPNEQTATNPQTNQTIVFRDGQWLDVATGKPLQ